MPKLLRYQKRRMKQLIAEQRARAGGPRSRPSPARRSLTNTLSALRSVGWGLPDKFVCRLRFTDNIDITSTVYTELAYRAIGPYDPRVAAGGDYPGYYSQISALYQYQRVLFSKIYVQFAPKTTATGAGGFGQAVLYPSTTANGVTAMNDAIDKRGAHHTHFNYYTHMPNSNMLSLEGHPDKLFGMSRDQYKADEDVRSLVGAVPARILYYIIGTQVNDLATAQATTMRVVITYTIEFSGLVPLDTVDSAND